MVLLITVSLNFIVKLRDFGGEFSSFYVLYALCISWMSDTGAYFSGTFFGKRKLCPSISPKKTIEGVIGGIAFSLAISILICFLFERFMFDAGVRVNFHYIIPISLLGSIISIIGDLAFSVIKRGCHAKDFGNIIPGHGGVLDRFDSLVSIAIVLLMFVSVTNLF
jgi:phosphatidate cytidylyltransferase